MSPSGIELLQEAVERLLKSYLIAMGWQLVKTHDLEALLRSALRYDPAFARFQRLATDLTRTFSASTIRGMTLRTWEISMILTAAKSERCWI